jgi:hypothetical protein
MKLNKILALVLASLVLSLFSAMPLVPSLPVIAHAPAKLLNIPGKLIGPIHESIFANSFNHGWF